MFELAATTGSWIPACAGMTRALGGFQTRLYGSCHGACREAQSLALFPSPQDRRFASGGMGAQGVEGLGIDSGWP
jgi:hypothetical protein